MDEKGSNLVKISGHGTVVQGGSLEDWLQDDGLTFNVGIHVLQSFQQRLQEFLRGIGPELKT